MNKRVSFGFAVLTGVLALSLSLSLLVGCDSASADDGGEGYLGITEAQDGQSFDASVGDTITVTLPGNPTTGYAWAADLNEEAAALLTLEGEPVYRQDTAGTDVVGSGGVFTFTFTAKAAGQAELGLKYWRSFEPETAPLQTFSVDLDIK